MAENGEQTFIELEAGSEWRFELEADEDIAVRVSPFLKGSLGDVLFSFLLL